MAVFHSHTTVLLKIYMFINYIRTNLSKATKCVKPIKKKYSILMLYMNAISVFKSQLNSALVEWNLSVMGVNIHRAKTVDEADK